VLEQQDSDKHKQ